MDIPLKSDAFDLAFHPSRPIVCAGLINGKVSAFDFSSLASDDPAASDDNERAGRGAGGYVRSLNGSDVDESDEDDDGDEGAVGQTEKKRYRELWTARPTKKSIRALEMDHDGLHLWAGTKDKAIFRMDIESGKTMEERLDVHDAPISRLCQFTPNQFATGDDDGVIKLWDTRKKETVREYTQHFDWISDFMYVGAKKQLISTSGDGTLSVTDVRSNKHEVSEDQEDELLSITAVKGGQKYVVGTQLGILSIWATPKGLRDCVDRFPGHPSSVDSMVTIDDSTILTGSSDGLLRVVQILPHKFIGVLGSHSDMPVERIKRSSGDGKGLGVGPVDGDGVVQANGGRWVGSLGHDKVIKITDMKELLEPDSEDEEDKEKDDVSSEADKDSDDAAASPAIAPSASGPVDEEDSDGSDTSVKPKKKRRRKGGKEDPKPKKKNDFFADL